MSTAQPAIAIIEDNFDLREELTFFLQHRGYHVWGVASAEQFWKKLHAWPVDIVVIDLGLPGEDGFSVVDYLTELGKFGLIIVTARGQQQDKLRALNLGADLYLVKPVNFAELASAIDALWQRMKQERATLGSPQPTREVGDQWLLLSAVPSLKTPGGECLKLTSQEHALLSVLGRSPSAVFAKEALVELMFQFSDGGNTHRIDVILSRLRKKAKDLGIDLPVRSIFGKGLVFVGNIEERSGEREK